MDVVDDLAEVVALPPARVADRAEVPFNKDRFISPAEKMPPEPVAGVDAPGEGKPRRDSGMEKAFGKEAEWKTLGRSRAESILKPGHALDKVGMGRLEDPMVVIVHQDPLVGLELREGAGLGQSFGEKLAVGIVEDDGLPSNATPRSAIGEMRSVTVSAAPQPIATGHDVVGGVLVFDPGCSGQGIRVMPGEGAQILNSRTDPNGRTDCDKELPREVRAWKLS